MDNVATALTAPVNSDVCDATPTPENAVPFADPEKWRHLVITLTPAQRKALQHEASREGFSQRAMVQRILAAWLRKPTMVRPVTAAPDRIRVKVNISDKVYVRLSAFAQELNVTMTAVSYTAIAHHVDL